MADVSREHGVRQEAEQSVQQVYRQIIDGWNSRDADTFAAAFIEDGEVIGFDGSQMHGRVEIGATLGRIFADHQTAPYLTRVRGVRLLTLETAILRAVAGMVPPGQSDIAPQLNATQTLVAQRLGGQWRAVLFQTTPAQYHGRPDLVDALTAELRELRHA